MEKNAFNVFDWKVIVVSATSLDDVKLNSVDHKSKSQIQTILRTAVENRYLDIETFYTFVLFCFH